MLGHTTANAPIVHPRLVALLHWYPARVAAYALHGVGLIRRPLEEALNEEIVASARRNGIAL